MKQRPKNLYVTGYVFHQKYNGGEQMEYEEPKIRDIDELSNGCANGGCGTGKI